MIHQLTYAGIGIYGVVLLCHAVRTRGSDLLEISSHLALVLFLGLLLRSLDDENVRKQIDTSTAILALSASLVSFVFGISIGKSWGMALAATAKSTRARDRDAGHDPKGSAEHYVVRPPQGGLATTLVSDFSRKERIFSDESVCSSKHATPSYTKGDPFKSRIQTAALLLSPSSRSETIDSFSGFNITQVFVDDTIDTLSTIVGASSKADAYKNKKWSLMTLSSNGSYLWTNADKRDGVMLKASTLSATPAHAVACWLLDRQIGTGLEGIMYRSETLLVNEKENICVQRFVCKSERVLLSSRCFLVVTAWRRLGDGSFIIVTRSVPPDVGKGLDKKSVRGCVYASGFLIRTLPEAAEGRSTELLFGVHISFSRSGKSNIDKAKLDEISKCISNSLSQAAVGAADPYNISEQGIESTEAEDRDSLELSQKQRSEVLSVARDTLVKLAHLHHTAPRGDLSAGILQFGCIPHVQADSSEVESGGSNWNDIYNFDGISVSERSDERKTIGTLRATCMIDAPPSVIHDLLTKHSEVFPYTH